MKRVTLILAVITIFLLAGCTETELTPTPQTAAPAILPSFTASSIPSPTPEPATVASQATSSPTATATIPPTGTSLPSPTAAPLPSPTGTPVARAVNPSSTGTSALGAGGCSVPPTGSFLTIWQNQPDIRAALGCPFEPHPRVTPQVWPVQTSYQPFEQGAMLWSDHLGWYAQPVIYVIYADMSYERFDDNFDPATDPSGGETVDGRVEPALGFGKLWRNQVEIQERLGWPAQPEQPGEAYIQMFEGGEMIWLSQTNRTYVFIRDPGEVQSFEGTFSLQ